jgi:uncharacterized lipoprotein
MRDAIKPVLLAAAVLALAACHKQQPQAQQEQNIAIDEDGLSNGMPANADIEELPPDESSGTSSNELETGEDNPDVNDLNASANSY